MWGCVRHHYKCMTRDRALNNMCQIYLLVNVCSIVTSTANALILRYLVLSSMNKVVIICECNARTCDANSLCQRAHYNLIQLLWFKHQLKLQQRQKSNKQPQHGKVYMRAHSTCEQPPSSSTMCNHSNTLHTHHTYTGIELKNRIRKRSGYAGTHCFGVLDASEQVWGGQALHQTETNIL